VKITVKMSFFSSLVANVTSGVANLGINSRRFSRQDSNETSAADGSSSSKPASTPSITVSTTSNLSTQHGECKHNSFIGFLFGLFIVSFVDLLLWLIISS
jgi:hypothetical protein